VFLRTDNWGRTQKPLFLQVWYNSSAALIKKNKKIKQRQPFPSDEIGYVEKVRKSDTKAEIARSTSFT
jgi:hypothetical protein